MKSRTKKKLLGGCMALGMFMLAAAALPFAGQGRQAKAAEPSAAPATATLYQLAPEARSLLQSYVIRTQNGKLIVIDGGIDGDGHLREPYLPAALRAIAGVEDGEYFEVEAWFLSHAHKDHFYELAKMLNRYTSDSNYKINHFYFDFPDFGSEEYPGTTADLTQLGYLKEGLSKYADVNGLADAEHYYDAVNGAVVNADAIAEGLEFDIDGVRIEVMQTYVASDGNDTNNNSLVLRAWVGGQSVLFLSDLGAAGGVRLLKTYGDGVKSDIVQMAHHGQTGVRKPVYDAIDAPVHLWTTPIWVWTDPAEYEIETNREWVNGGEDFVSSNAYNIVSCLYPAYPLNSTRASSWASVIGKMSIPLPYTVDFESFTDIGVDGWMASADETGTVMTDQYGFVYSNTGAFRLLSDRTAWADRFGVAFRADAEQSDGVRVILSSEEDAWYEQATQSVAIEFVPVREDGEIVSSKVSLFAGDQKLGEYNTVMFNWTADRSYSTNYVYLGKRDGKWILNINDGVIETDADQALDAALANFTDRCGYYQFENLGGEARVTFIGIQYGLPASGSGSPHEGFAHGPVLDPPRWTLTEEGEVAAWAPNYGAPYTIKSSVRLPLNGFEMKTRFAHGEGPSAVMFALTSLYGGADWYAGTYSLVFRVQWDPSFGKDEASVQLMVYHPDTEKTGEEPIKLTARVEDFGWFKGTEFAIERVRGVWNITLNGKAVFENKTSSDGKSADDYMKFLQPYFAGGMGYLQVWEQQQQNGTVSNTGYIIETLTFGEANAAPVINAEALSSVVGKQYAVGEDISIDLKQLFADADGDALSFFATKGTVTDGIWTYRAAASELLFVTFTASDGTDSVQKRVSLSIGEETEQTKSGCAGTADAGVCLAAAAAGVCIIRKKRREEQE